MNNPAGIGEHPEILEAIDSQVAKYAEAQEKLQVLKEYYRWLTVEQKGKRRVFSTGYVTSRNGVAV